MTAAGDMSNKWSRFFRSHYAREGGIGYENSILLGNKMSLRAREIELEFSGVLAADFSNHLLTFIWAT